MQNFCMKRGLPVLYFLYKCYFMHKADRAPILILVVRRFDKSIVEADPSITRFCKLTKFFTLTYFSLLNVI